MPPKARDPVQLTHARARHLLDYDEASGHFTWRVDRGHAFKAGTRAGHQRPDGYRAIFVDGRHTLEHRLAVFWVTGAWPGEYVDHENGDRADNRFANLRCCTHKENVRFRGGGVNQNTRGEWIASIGMVFPTEEEARACRAALEQFREQF